MAKRWSLCLKLYLEGIFKVETDIFSPLELPSGIIVGAADVKTTGTVQFLSE